ncbi:MAG: hypothetical protein JRJ20_09915 [Deltaproteobacteria bacterium]|nr:hypothetical protein [Deltaproteobacteria bacterium]MBW2143007.1 hypothetical protein [Deltaproteobacteria bacterium]
MRLKSTGLGATELFGDLTEMEKSMSGVLMRVKIKKPVVWRVRVYLNPQDLRTIVWRALMPRTVFFVIKTLLGNLRSSDKKNDPSESSPAK